MLTTKPSRGGSNLGARSVVARPALFALPSAATPGGVRLISAPDGSGKTFLLRSWIEHPGIASRVARVSVDRGERDAPRFWLGVLAKLRVQIRRRREFVDYRPRRPQRSAESDDDKSPCFDRG